MKQSDNQSVRAIRSKGLRGFHSRFIRKLLASYLVVVMLPIITFTLIAVRDIHRAYQDEENALQTSAQNASDSLGSLLDKMQAALTLTNGTDSVRNLTGLARCTDPEKIRRLIQVRSYANALAHAVSSEGELLIYSNECQFMVTTGSVYIDLDNGMERLESQYSGYAWADVVSGGELFDTLRFEYFSIPGPDDSSALAIGKAIYTKVNQARLCLMFVIFPQEIIENVLVDEANDYAVFWKDQLVACTLEGDARLDWKAGDVSTFIEAEAASRDYPAFRVTVLKSRQSVSESVAPIVRNLVILIMCLCAMTLLLILALAYVNNKPFDQLLALLFGEQEARKQIRRDWKDINDSIRSILSDNQNLRSEMRYQNESLRQNLLYGMISSACVDQRAALNMLMKLGVQVDSEVWAVLISCDFDEENVEPLYTSMLVKKLLSKNFRQLQDETSIDVARYLLLVDGGVSAETLRSEYDAFREELSGVAEITPRAAAVRIRSLAELFDAYTTAGIVIGMSSGQALDIVMEQVKSDGVYVYPEAVSEQLRRAVRDGDLESLTQCAATIEETCVSGGIDAEALNHLRRAIYMDVGSVLTRMEEIPVDMAEQALADLNEIGVSDPLQFTKNMVHVLEPVLSAIREVRRSLMAANSTELGRSVMAFIDAHMTDPALSLNMIASHFGFSESYISSIVKSETSVGFVSYCEERRVAVACEALCQGKDLKSAAQAAGYASQLTFRRAFKKVKGVNPSEYAQRAQAQDSLH